MGVAFSLPFAVNSGGGTNVTDNERKQVMDRVIATLMTPVGTRVQRPTFGTEIPNLVFDNESDALIRATEAVTAAFATFLTDLTLIHVDTKMDTVNTDDMVLIITVDYKLPTKVNDQVTLKVGSFTRSGTLIQEIQ